MKAKVWVSLFFWSACLFAVRPDLKRLPIGLAPWEKVDLRSAPLTSPPKGPVRSLAEWEEAEAVMTLWTNPSLVKALALHGNVKLIADTREDQSWWENWLDSHGIDKTKISYYRVATDSMWIRDYGPWFILDGDARFGVVDTKYNRPRPQDDLVPLYIAKQLGIPFYQPGLVHTGGNYYNDALGNAFSSTLVYSENPSLNQVSVNNRMHDYLGIERYTTSRLAPGITIEHLDTFGKLVSPDTWVFSDFPAGSPYRADSENMVSLLKTLKSPYGTPYKIFRLKMVSRNGSSYYRAYINSFISNHALYFPAYGDSVDNDVKALYQKALPGYDIVPVDAEDTEWGDSVHCRNRNLLTDKTVFIFPTVSQKNGDIEITAEVVPSPGARINELPELHWKLNGEEQMTVLLNESSGRFFTAKITNQVKGSQLSFWITVTDSTGKKKSAPPFAPQMTIDLTVE